MCSQIDAGLPGTVVEDDAALGAQGPGWWSQQGGPTCMLLHPRQHLQHEGNT